MTPKQVRYSIRSDSENDTTTTMDERQLLLQDQSFTIMSTTTKEKNHNEIQTNLQLLYIDNRHHTYVPIQLQFDIPHVVVGVQQQKQCNNHSNSNTAVIRSSCCVTIMCRPEIMCPKLYSNYNVLIECLRTDIYYCLTILPQSVRSLLLRTKIWINNSYCYGSSTYPTPTYVNHITTHHSTIWLEQNYDIIQKVHGIEIYNCQDYIRMRHHWNGSGLLLHEYCHLIHQHVLGLDNNDINTLYNEIVLSKKYDHVLRRDWAGKVNTSSGTKDDMDCAYCMINVKEFFAEMSVTYLAQTTAIVSSNNNNTNVNDNDPLDTADRYCMEDCSPPITEPTVRQRFIHHNYGHIHPKYDRLLSITPTKIEAATSNTSKVADQRSSLVDWFKKLFAFNDDKKKRNSYCNPVLLPHCNKFYPFTSGQLHYYDIYLYERMKEIWDVTIPQWIDPYNIDTTTPTNKCKTADTRNIVVHENDNNNNNDNECYVCFWKWVQLPFRYHSEDDTIIKENNKNNILWFTNDNDNNYNENKIDNNEGGSFTDTVTIHDDTVDL